MKSRASFYNAGFGRNLLRRFWPLWAAWLAFLLLAGPARAAAVSPADYFYEADYLNELNRSILVSGRDLCYYTMAAGPLMAMAMLSYLYNPRSCGLINSLPIRREEAYGTAFLTGLVPMLAADLLAWLVMLALFGRTLGVERHYLALWLGMLLMGTVAFYGIACFCGVLTGNVLVLPAVYVVLCFTAVVAEEAVRALFSTLIYGYGWDRLLFDWLSPIPALLTRLDVRSDTAYAGAGRESEILSYRLEGMGYLAALCAAGVVLAVIAAFLLRKRHMEAAGEIVAVPVLKPLFRICMAVGTAIVFACLLLEGLFGRHLSGHALAAAAVLLLWVGAFLGWYAAEMLMKKSLRVFGGNRKPLLVICACLALCAILADLDVAGYEAAVPSADSVESVICPGSSAEVSDPDFIAQYCAFHQGIVAHKAENEASPGNRRSVIPLHYRLRDGGTLTRLYYIPNNERTQRDPDSDISHYEALQNQPPLILKRVLADLPVRADNVLYWELILTQPDSFGVWHGENVGLSLEQALALYREGILPDAEEGNIGRYYLGESTEMQELETNLSFSLEITEDAAADSSARYFRHMDVRVLSCSAHTLAWLQEHLGLAPQNLHGMK